MTYEQIKDCVDIYSTPCTAQNQDGETVIIEKFRDENDKYFFRTTTIQKNNWMRINEYYADGTVTETYE